MPDGTSSSLSQVKISELPVATAVNDADQLEANQAGTSRSITVAQVKAAAVAAVPVPPAITDVSPRSFGAVGDGITDDTVALQAAINAVSAAGGGNVNCTGGRWLIDSANLLVRNGVFLVGPWSNLGQPPGASSVFDYSQVKSAFIVNPAYTIQLIDRDCGVQGMAVLRKGIVTPATLRQAVDLVATFAGTGITIGDGTSRTAEDAWLSNLFVAGFATGISSSFSDRSRIQYISGDNLAGIYILHSADIQHLSHVHFWPFLTAGFVPGNYTVSGAADNGSGLVRLTISTSVLVTGDRVFVQNVGGATGANGVFTVTVISPTTIDLQGSTFGGAYTSGGTVSLNPWHRSGVGIFFDNRTDWGQMDHCFCLGYAIGIEIKDGNQNIVLNCGVDGGDASTIGILVTGTATATSVIGCISSAQGVGLKCDTTATTRNTVQVSGHRVQLSYTYSYEVSNGWANFVNCESGTSPVQTIRMDDAALGANFIGGDLVGVLFSYQSNASPRPSFLAVRGWAAAPLDVNLTTTTATNTLAQYSIHKTPAAANDSIIKRYYLTDTAAGQIEVLRENYRATSVTAGAVSGQMFWSLAQAGTLTAVLGLTPTQLTPLVNATMLLGSPTTAWANLYLSSAGTINWNNGAYVLTQNGASLGTSGALGVGLGATAATGQLQVRGTGQATASIDTTTNLGSTAYLQSNTTLAGDGGMVMFGCNAGAYAVIKGLAVSGTSNTTGDLVVSNRRINTDTTLTETARFLVNGNTNLAGVPTALAATAIGAGAATQAFVKGSSTASFGVFYGSGAPTFAAAANSLYLRSDGNSTTTRMYVNTTGSTTWATITTSA